MRPVAASSSTAAELGTELLEMQLRSLSLQLELMTRTLGQMEETNRAVVSELRDVGRGAKEQNNLMEQLLKKMDDIATKMVSTRSQRHHEDAEYVDDYVSNYEADYDPYGDYSHLETGAGPSPIVGGVAPAPPPMGSYRGQPFGAYPPPPPLGYPMAPPPPLGRPLAPPLPPQAFYSPQAAAAAAAVAAPGLRLAEGQVRFSSLKLTSPSGILRGHPFVKYHFVVLVYYLEGAVFSLILLSAVTTVHLRHQSATTSTRYGNGTTCVGGEPCFRI